MSEDDVLMRDTFESLRPGPIREAVDGPFREMHAQPASAEDNLGGWESRFGWWSLPKDAWRLVVSAERSPGGGPQGRFVESRLTATVYDNIWLAKGDLAWRDVAVETTVTLLPPGDGWGGPAGLLFRFQDSRRHYAACVDEDGRAKILKRHGTGWDVLASAPASIETGEAFGIRVVMEGARLRASIGPVELQAEDGEFTHGCVGFVGARPARFGPVTVTALRGERDRLEAECRDAASRLEIKRKRYGKAVPWRKLDTRGFGSGRRIRLGDLTGDGRLDFLLLQIDPERPPALGCMTAMSADGEVLWQLGQPRPAPEIELSADGPAQVHDIDGDGRCEV
ncbi:unnamed protein product, partial [marine sediment metagenome]